MTLDEFFKSADMSPADMSRETGLSPATIHRVLYGKQKVSFGAIKAIVEATGGKVTADDIIFGKPRQESEKRGAA